MTPPPEKPRSLISGFLRSLRANPGRSALELGEQFLSYEELWDYAGRISMCLKEILDHSER